MITTKQMRSTDVTRNHRTLSEHIRHGKGSKTICVTTCLNYFGIPFDAYHYTSSNKNRDTYINVMRKFGYSVRSRKSEFKASKFPTMTSLRREMKRSDYTSRDMFIVEGLQTKKAHLMVLNGEGETVIDTAKGMKWRVNKVSIVER